MLTLTTIKNTLIFNEDKLLYGKSASVKASVQTVIKCSVFNARSYKSLQDFFPVMVAMNSCLRYEQFLGVNPKTFGDPLTTLGNYADFFGNVFLWIIFSFPSNVHERFMEISVIS